MKLNKLFLLSAMGLGLFACNNNDLVEGSDPNGTQEEGTTYVGFTLKFNDTNSRADGTEEGTEAEQKINSAYVVMAGVDGTIEKVFSTSNAVESGEDYHSNDDKFVFQTSAGVHCFYAVVNPDVAGLPETALVAGKNISDYFNKEVSLDITEIANTNATGNFMMSSVKEVRENIADNVTEEQALNGTANSFIIDVERVAAKVTMTTESTTLENATNNADGTISSPVFYLRDMAKMSYRMAQTSISEISANTYSDAITYTAVYVKGPDDDTNLHEKATPAYCLENLHLSSGYEQGNTTYLALSTTFSPAKVVDPDATQVKPLQDNNYTGESANKTFYVVNSGELAGNYLMEEDLKQFRGGDLTSSTELPAGVEAISAPYTGGTCWFGPIWIGQETSSSNDAPIFRNTWYNLKITGIELPGEPEEPKLNEGEPLVPPTNVAITLTVMPWNFIDRGIDLQ